MTVQRWLGQRAMLTMLLAALVATCVARPVRAQSAADLTAFRSKLSRLLDQGNYAEALPVAERYVELSRQMYGEEHTEYATAISWLAYVYHDQRRYAEAEPLYLRSLAIREKAQGPDHPDIAGTLNYLAQLYRAQRRYTEAEPLHKRSLAVREKALGPDHPDVARALNNLAALYLSQDRFSEAEPLYKRSLAIREKAMGSDHADVATALNNLAELYRRQDRYAEAEQLHLRSLSIHEKALGPDHLSVSKALSNLSTLYRDQGRYAEAEPFAKRSLAIAEKALGPEHPDLVWALTNLAGLYEDQGRYAEAESLAQRDLAISEKALGSDHPSVGRALSNLATMHLAQGRYANAEPLYKRSLAIHERIQGPDHPHVGDSLGHLGALYLAQGRYAEAEPLYLRSLAIHEKALGPDHLNVARALSNLAALYASQGRYAEAEPFARRSLAIRQKVLGPEHPDVATLLNNLAVLYRAQGRYAEAESLAQRSLVIREKTLGTGHPHVGEVLNNLARLYQAQYRYTEAEPLAQRSLAIAERALGRDHPSVAEALDILARLSLAKRDWQRAAERWQASTAVIERRTERGFSSSQGGAQELEAARWRSQFIGLVKMMYRIALQGRAGVGDRGGEMFLTAQWALGSEAASSLANMAARSATGTPELASLVRERQDLITEWQAKDKLLIAAKSDLPIRRKPDAEEGLSNRLRAIDARLSAIDAQLGQDFPEYAAMSSPKPISVADVQANLRSDEALVLFLNTGELKPVAEETFIWVVTKTGVRWARSDLGTTALANEVAALRCGLDETAWSAADSQCAKLTGVTYTALDNFMGKPLPFDMVRAYALYKSLLGGVEDALKRKHLLIVPSGALSQLPFQVLVTVPPTPDAPLKDASWLAHSHALTILPAVSSLKALRQNAKASAAPEPFIGYGNPVLAGEPGCGKIIVPDKCPADDVKIAAAAKTSVARSVGRPAATPEYFRDGLADVEAVARLCPLPDTAHELSCVAKSLGARTDSVVLGAAMTEAAVKHAPLARYKVIHFATHGLLAGEMATLSRAGAEPALVMTPPKAATTEDDGLLVASEIAALSLDADWVVMSACNTAGPAAQDGEALSGLARAFFYAGARALLVSHWPVNSYAATMLTSRTFAELHAQPKIGRAEAFRRAMLALVSGHERRWATHPSVWAPFVIVGEGGATAR